MEKSGWSSGEPAPNRCRLRKSGGWARFARWLTPRTERWPTPASPTRRTCTSSDRKSTRLNSSHDQISYAVFCLKKKKKQTNQILIVSNKKKDNFQRYIRL